MNQEARIAAACVVVPTLNEVAHIGAVLDELIIDPAAACILVMDGGSVDGTQDIVQSYQRASLRVRLVKNPEKNQAFAVNSAAREAARLGHDILVRIDAHARYPDMFVTRLVQTLHETGADSVTVPLIALAGQRRSGWPSASADLQRSWLGNGGARHRNRGRSGWVDHGHHAAFALNRFLALGGYDRRFAACEDVDFDHRLRASGGKIWCEDSLAVAYRPRRTPGALWRQMYRNGTARLQFARKHGTGLNLRQKLPLLAIALAAPSALAGWLHPLLWTPAATYLGAVMLLAFAACSHRTPKHLVQITVLAVTSHGAFATGLLAAKLSVGPRRAEG